jgi:hypothetical protein
MVRERVVVVEGGFWEGSAKYILTHPIVVTPTSPPIYLDDAASLGGEGNTIVTTSQLDVHALPTALVNTDHSSGGEGPDLVLLTIQGALTTIVTSRTQAQAPPSIVVVNVVGNVTKGE